jgi:hypothetical protein
MLHLHSIQVAQVIQSYGAAAAAAEGPNSPFSHTHATGARHWEQSAPAAPLVSSRNLIGICETRAADRAHDHGEAGRHQ